MRPNFALSLSFDGIRLLHRAAGGWRLVGDVDLEADDLAVELAMLRKTAAAMEPAGVRCKLLIPNEQIRYLTLDTPGMDTDKRLSAARAALDGATPYAVADLAFDISPDGDRTHVSAVAKDTLAEAEAFAREHRFHPVSFVAVPGDQAFLGEPFFGPTSNAEEVLEPGDSVMPDGVAVVVIGSLDVPSGPVAEPGPELLVSAPEIAPVAPSRPKDRANGTAGAGSGRTIPTLPEAQADIAAFGFSEPAGENPIRFPNAAVDGSRITLGAPAATGFVSRRSPPPQQSGATGGMSLDAPSPVVPRTPPEPAARKPVGPVAKPSSPSVRAPVADAVAAPAALAVAARPNTPDQNAVSPPEQPPAPEIRGGQTRRPASPDIGQARRAMKSGHLGIVLTVILLGLLAAVAAWAAVYLDDELARFFRPAKQEFVQSSTPPPPLQVVTPEPQQPAVRPAEPERTITASLDATLTDEDAAVLDALRRTLPEPAPQEPLGAEADRIEIDHAVTGIWLQPPEPAEPPALILLDDLYLTSIDSISSAQDAVALPDVALLDTDAAMAAPNSPAASGTRFALDDRGLVIPTREGALNPDGITVFLGRPALVPPETPARAQTSPKEQAAVSAMAERRPRLRPEGLIENNERATLDGMTRSELAQLRPQLRPESAQDIAEQGDVGSASLVRLDDATPAQPLQGATPDPLAGATARAVARSARPDARPKNFSRIVESAQPAAPQPKAETIVVSVEPTVIEPRQVEPKRVEPKQVAPKSVAPKIPSSASVSRQATSKNAINLRELNLIGVYGKPSDRRALVRLSTGRYQKVRVGDRIDGGKVSAIGDSELRYQKSGRNVVLKMPKT